MVEITIVELPEPDYAVTEATPIKRKRSRTQLSRVSQSQKAKQEQIDKFLQAGKNCG